MFKSKEAKAWEAKAQHLVDLITHHNDEAAKFHVAGDHKREDRHNGQCAKLLRQLAELVDARPPGTKPPKIPSV